MKRRLAAWGIALLAILLILPISAVRADADAQDLTACCHIDGDADGDTLATLSDNDVGTWVELPPDRVLTIRWEDAVCGGILLEWLDIPDKYWVSFANGENKTLFDDPYALNDYLSIPDDATSLTLGCPEGERLCGFRVFGLGELPQDLQQWQRPAPGVDLMLFSAHCDDELVFMGGVLPTCIAEGRNVQVVYFAASRARMEEGLAGLWAIGVRNAPIFLGYRDILAENMDDQIRVWGGWTSIERKIVTLLRVYRPLVVVTHDTNGEYGHGAHFVASRALRFAVKDAASDALFPLEGQETVYWQVHKCYLHMYTKDAVRFDFDRPLASYDGKTANEVAQIGLDCHVSQHDHYPSVHVSGTFDDHLWGLFLSTVGAEEHGLSFFENIPTDVLSKRYEPTPTPVPTPTPTATPKATAVPAQARSDSAATPVPQPTDAPDAVETADRTDGNWLWIVLGTIAAAAVVLGVFLLRRMRKR